MQQKKQKTNDCTKASGSQSSEESEVHVVTFMWLLPAVRLMSDKAQ